MNGMPIDTVVDLHNTIALQKSCVSFGIRGKAPSETRRRAFTEQSLLGMPTYFYIVQRNKGAYRAFRGVLISLFDHIPSQSTFPTYYLESKLTESFAFWVSIGELKLIGDSMLENLHIDTSQSRVMQVLSKSMASVMFVA